LSLVSQEVIEMIIREKAEEQLSTTLIEEIKDSPMKIQILEKWEHEVFAGLRNASKMIWGCVRQFSIDYDDEDMCYCDIGSGPICWENYSLLLQLAREKREISVCADTRNLVRKPWTGWTEILFERFMPREEWSLKGPHFIFNLQHELMIAEQYELWFKFKLKFVAASLSKLDPPELVQYEHALKDKDGKILGIAQEEVLLTLKVRTSYQGEYLKDHKHALMLESFVGCCLDDFLFPIPNVP
jgi:hypothetical protein